MSEVSFYMYLKRMGSAGSCLLHVPVCVVVENNRYKSVILDMTHIVSLDFSAVHVSQPPDWRRRVLLCH